MGSHTPNMTDKDPVEKLSRKKKISRNYLYYPSIIDKTTLPFNKTGPCKTRKVRLPPPKKNSYK